MKHQELIDAAEKVRGLVSEARKEAEGNNRAVQVTFLQVAQRHLDDAIKALCHAQTQAQFDKERQLSECASAGFEAIL